MKRHAPLGCLLWLASCLGAQDHALFEGSADSISAAGSSTGGSAPAQAGTASATSGSGGSSGSNGEQVGEAGSSSQLPAGAAGAAGGAPAGDEPVLVEDCSMVEGSTVGEGGHCYRVNEAELTFADARNACAEAAGHLVTIGSEAENSFAASLHDGEHWIGATDGRSDDMPGVGPYVWVNGEDFGYSDWEDEQPNAFETDCPDGSDESDCFEHCAFQSDEGDWNDRSCWHTIVSICEWDVEPGAAGAGAGGAAP